VIVISIRDKRGGRIEKIREKEYPVKISKFSLETVLFD